MTNSSNSLYDSLVFKHSKWVLALFVLLLLALSPYAGNFRLDASSDSLVLENDKSLKYFREVVAKYNTADLLLVTYSPKGELFSDAVLQDIKSLREKLIEVDQVSSIISILDAPLMQSPPVSLAELTGTPRLLLSEGTDRELAKKEFVSSTLYKDLLVSSDYSTTAIVMSLKGDAELSDLLDQRNELRELKASEGLSNDQASMLDSITLKHQAKTEVFQQKQSAEEFG